MNVTPRQPFRGWTNSTGIGGPIQWNTHLPGVHSHIPAFYVPVMLLPALKLQMNLHV
jgi:hypothetical protein